MEFNIKLNLNDIVLISHYLWEIKSLFEPDEKQVQQIDDILIKLVK